MSQAGIKYLLKTPTDEVKAFQSAPPAKADFTAIGGIQSNSESFNVNLIDITSKSSNNNRELLERSGVLSLDMDGSGVLMTDVLTNSIRQTFDQRKQRWFLIEEPSGAVKIAKVMFESFNVTASFDNAVEFDFSLRSSGTIYKEDKNGVKWDSGQRKFSNFQSSVDPYDVILQLSQAYAADAIPANKQTAFDTYLKTVNFLNASKVSRDIDDANSLRGDEAGKFVFPFFLLLKSDLTGKNLQVLDALNLPIVPGYIGEYDDDTGVTWVAYYLDQPLANNESISFKINIFD